MRCCEKSSVGSLTCSHVGVVACHHPSLFFFFHFIEENGKKRLIIPHFSNNTTTTSRHLRGDGSDARLARGARRLRREKESGGLVNVDHHVLHRHHRSPEKTKGGERGRGM